MKRKTNSIAEEPKSNLWLFLYSWEQRKLGDLAQFSKGSGYSKSDIKNNGTPIILYGRLYTQYETVISDVDTFADEKDGSVYSRGGEVVIPASGETAEDISIASVVAKSGILLGGDLNIITPQNIIDPTFLAISISNGKPHQDMAKMAQGKSVVHLHNTDLEKINLLYPKLAEQQQISRYFCQIDHLITLHQRNKIITHLRHASTLEQNYNAWEQRKLGEVAAFNPKDELPDEFEYVDLESVVGIEMLFHRTEKRKTAPSRAQRLARKGDLFYQTVRPYQKNNYLFEKSDNNYVFSTGYTQMRPYIDGYFLLSLVQSEQFVEVVLNNCTGTSYPAISSVDLAEIEVYSPKEEHEHRQIGAFFRSLDTIITLHQRKP